MFVQPAAGDAGGALGAAKWLHHGILGQTRREPLTTALLGARYSPQQIERALTKHYDVKAYITYNDDDSLCEAVADLIVGGKVIGWFQGRSEWGPRALGNRSILASPCEPTIQARVNEKIKFRELFRPFAPAVIAEAAAQYFEMTDVSAEPPLTSPYCFMLTVCKVRASMRDRIPAVTHVDGTARLQLVHSSVNPSFYRLIQAFAARSGIPVLLNTSFNLRGEPIVETPEDAIKTFEFSGMDALVLERTIIAKENLR
jgi:carbamoyltransferase